MTEARSLPKLVRVEHFVDSAFKDGIANDFSVCATWGIDSQWNAYLLDLWRRRVEFPDLVANLERIYKARRVPLVIEDKASGQSAIQVLRRQGIPVIAYPGKEHRNVAAASKESRAEAVTWIVESGKAYVPANASWKDEFIDEHAAFPQGSHDDMVDTTSMALSRLILWRKTRPTQDGTPYKVGDSHSGGSASNWDPFTGEREQLRHIGQELRRQGHVVKPAIRKDEGGERFSWQELERY